MTAMRNSADRNLAGCRCRLSHGESTKYFYPPYVGVRGWVGIVLAQVDDDGLTLHVQDAWKLVAPRRLRHRFKEALA